VAAQYRSDIDERTFYLSITHSTRHLPIKSAEMGILLFLPKVAMETILGK
jgi:hypothetical protein